MTEKKSQFWPRGAKKHVNTAKMRRRRVILIKKKCRTVLLAGTVTVGDTLAQGAPKGFQGSPPGLPEVLQRVPKGFGECLKSIDKLLESILSSPLFSFLVGAPLMKESNV